MKHIGITLLVLGLALGASTLSAAQTGNTAITLKGHTDGGANFWTMGDAMEHNPTISVPANTEITVSFTAVTGSHNLKIGSTTSEIIGEGDPAQTVKFTSGADGTDTEYICTVHGAGMAGKFHVGSATTTTPKTDGDKKSPGFEVVALGLAVVGIALLLRRRN